MQLGPVQTLELKCVLEPEESYAEALISWYLITCVIESNIPKKENNYEGVTQKPVSS